MPLPSDRLPADLRSLPRKVADLERQVRELLAAKRLEHSSIDGGALVIRDASGEIAARLGTQADGTVALSTVTGPPPPTPSAPIVTEELAALSITWDGTFADGAAIPADWLHVEIHVSADPAFIPDQATLRATLQNPAGGTALIALDYVAWQVKLRAVSTSGAVSTPTDAVAGTPRQAGGGDITADAINGKTITGATINGGTVIVGSAPNAQVKLISSAGEGFLTFPSNRASENFTAEVAAGVVNPGAATESLCLQVNGPQVTTYTHSMRMQINSQPSDGSDTPSIQFVENDTNQLVLDLRGNQVTSYKNLEVLGIAATTFYIMKNGAAWTAPTMSTGWATGTGIGGTYPPLRYRLDAEDNIHLFGVFHATAANPVAPIATGFPLINFTNTGGVGVAGVAAKMAAGSTYIPMYINDTGQLRSTNLPTIAANDTFMINALVPIGNLT